MRLPRWIRRLRSSLVGAVPLAIGGFWLVLAPDSAGYSVMAVAAGLAVDGFVWQHWRRKRRFAALLDAYAEREIARAAIRPAPRQPALGDDYGNQLMITKGDAINTDLVCDNQLHREAQVPRFAQGGDAGGVPLLN